MLLALHDSVDQMQDSEMGGGHVTCVGEKKNTYGVLVAKPGGGNHLEDISLDWR